MAKAREDESGKKCSACDGRGSWRGIECSCVREQRRRIEEKNKSQRGTP